MCIARAEAFVILDGTLLPIDRIAADTPYYSASHKRHGMNVQVLADPFGRLLWASPALPGSTHDLTAARIHGIVDALADVDLKAYADKAYQGADRSVRVPFRGRSLKRWQRRHNSTHTKIRCLGEQAMASQGLAPAAEALFFAPEDVERVVSVPYVAHSADCSARRISFSWRPGGNARRWNLARTQAPGRA